MSREVKATPRTMSIDPDEVPAGMMALTFHVPIEAAANLRLGDPVTLTIPEGVAR